MIVKLGDTISEDFTVVDLNGEDPITGLLDGDFIKKLFDPDGNEVSGSIEIIISELGSGNYRASFTLNTVGTWYIVIYHVLYFPWGKQGTIQVVGYDLDSIGDLITRTLGLTQENQYIDNTSYDSNDNLISCRIRIYNNKTKVGTDSNIIATYLVTAGYTNSLLDYYKVVRQ